MDACDVLIAGGGPAGSACAWALQNAGLDVVVMDRAVFPRDKVCAGWITPQVVDELRIDLAEYRDRRTLQPITAFRVGMIGANETVEVTYDGPVSFGIRRCEFDDYLLRRSGARVCLGTSVTSLRRSGGYWIVNDTIRSPMLVGAGGHSCPVARLLNGDPDRAPLIAAQEVEFPIDPDAADGFTTAGNQPELYFCPDLKGYGWCFRKQGHLNIGFGRIDARALPKATAAFVSFLKVKHTIPADTSSSWRGHAYLLAASERRRALDDGVVLAGDAAGLAYPQSGEGIRPAIESGLIAASTIVEAAGRYTRDRLHRYEAHLQDRFGVRPVEHLLSHLVPPLVTAAAARRLLGNRWFVRRVLLDQWFLHAHQPALAAQPAMSLRL